MGVKGKSISVTDLSAAYVTLKGLSDKIREFVADIQVHQKGIIAEVEGVNIDSESAESIDDILNDLGRICGSIVATLTEIQKKLDAGLEASKEIQKIAQRQAGAVKDNVQSTGRKFKR